MALPLSTIFGALKRSFHCINRPNVRSSSFYVVLPEIPPDTEETNPVMRPKDFPKFSEISPQNIVSGCAKQTLEFQTELEDHAESLMSLPEKTFQNVLEPIEKHIVPMYYAWRLANNMAESNILFTNSFQRIDKHVARTEYLLWLNEPLHNAVKEVSRNRDNLTEYQAQLVDLYLSQGKMQAVHLAGESQKRFHEMSRKLSALKGKFGNNVHMCDKMFSHRFSSFSVIDAMPKSLAYHMAEDKSNPFRGPWKVTLQRNMYENFLDYCNDRSLRWNVWRAFNNRASPEVFDQMLSNHNLIPDIRSIRRDMANLLDHENYARLSLQNKMAGSVENVLSMMETIRSNFKPQAENEIEYLQNFAESCGFKDSLRMWDIQYWRKKQYQQIHHLDDAVIAEHLPLPKVMEGLFSLCNKLFGIKIEKSSEVDVFEESVQFFNVFNEDGSYLSSFYFDPFSRESKKSVSTTMVTGRDKSDDVGVKPFCYLRMNIPPPLDEKTSPTLSLDEVSNLFSEFGRGLQQMSSKVPYSQLAGDRNLELDARDICSLFMVNWLYTPDVLRDISQHSGTGQPLPDEMINDIIKARRHMSSYDMMRQLYFGALDLEIHMSKGDWFGISKDVWHEYMPMPLDADDNHTCSFSAIFAGSYAAAYYSNKWAEMIAADCFDAFLEVGLKNNKNISNVGRRFKDTFLSLAGGIPSSEIFRKFRGRDPSIDALQTMYGIKTDGSSKKDDIGNVVLETN